MHIFVIIINLIMHTFVIIINIAKLFSNNVKLVAHTTDPWLRFDNDNDKYMHRNISEFLVFFVRYFPTLRC